MRGPYVIVNGAAEQPPSRPVRCPLSCPLLLLFNSFSSSHFYCSSLINFAVLNIPHLLILMFVLLCVLSPFLPPFFFQSSFPSFLLSLPTLFVSSTPSSRPPSPTFKSTVLFFCTVLSYPVPSFPFLSCPVLSCPVLSCPVLSCPVLSCPVLSCPVLS